MISKSYPLWLSSFAQITLRSFSSLSPVCFFFIQVSVEEGFTSKRQGYYCCLLAGTTVNKIRALMKASRVFATAACCSLPELYRKLLVQPSE